MYKILTTELLAEFEKRIDSLFSTDYEKKNGLFDKLKPSGSNIWAWKAFESKKHPECHESVQYMARLKSLGVETINNAAVITNSRNNSQTHICSARITVKGEDKAEITVDEGSVLAKDIENCTHRLPMAICLGGDAIYSEIASIPIPEWVDGYTLAGFLKKKSVEIASCFTQEVKVPCDSDFILEGYIQKSEVATGNENSRIFHITCITHKLKAVLSPETESYFNKNETDIITERLFLPLLKKMHSEIIDLHINTQQDRIIVKTGKYYKGIALRTASILWATEAFAKINTIIVTGTETDIRNNNSVEKAIISSETICFGDKVCMDATHTH